MFLSLQKNFSRKKSEKSSMVCRDFSWNFVVSIDYCMPLNSYRKEYNLTARSSELWRMKIFNEKHFCSMQIDEINYSRNYFSQMSKGYQSLFISLNKLQPSKALRDPSNDHHGVIFDQEKKTTNFFTSRYKMRMKFLSNVNQSLRRHWKT